MPEFVCNSLESIERRDGRIVLQFDTVVVLVGRDCALAVRYVLEDLDAIGTEH